MSEKKCRMCGDDAEWKLDGDCYCEFCARDKLDVHSFATPRICEMCGDALDRVYYTDGECNAFCSAKCALEYCDAEKLDAGRSKRTMSDNNIKTVYTQEEVKAMMCACLKGINASSKITPAYNSIIYRILDDMQNQFSQILRILSAEYNEICETVEAFEREEQDVEKHKKCKMCCSDAKWVWKGSYYCRVCLRAELEVFEQNIPYICEMCGDPLDDVYYADGEGNPFCSPECALEYNGAKKLEREQEDDESGD